jgi:hypothetical protein
MQGIQMWRKFVRVNAQKKKKNLKKKPTTQCNKKGKNLEIGYMFPTLARFPTQDFQRKTEGETNSPTTTYD